MRQEICTYTEQLLNIPENIMLSSSYEVYPIYTFLKGKSPHMVQIVIE